MLSVCAVSSLLGGTHFAARLISASPFSIWANERFLMGLLKAAFSAGAAKMKTFVACLPVYPTLLPPTLSSRLPTTFVQKFFFREAFLGKSRKSGKTFFSFATGSKSGPMKYSPSSPLRKRESSALSSIERFSTEEKERGNLGAKNRVCKQAYSADVQRRRKRGGHLPTFPIESHGGEDKQDSLFFLCHSSK